MAIEPLLSCFYFTLIGLLMMERRREYIFPTIPERDFYGRDDIIEELYNLATYPEAGRSNNIYLYGRRKIGKTEILRRVYNRLFWKQDKTIPFYYSFPERGINIYELCRDFLSSFLRQYVAFIKKDTTLINGGAPLLYLRDLIREGHAPVVSSLIDNLYGNIESGDLLGAVKTSISSPSFVSHVENARVFIAIDDFQNTDRLDKTEKEGIFKELEGLLKLPSLTCIFASYSLNKPVGAMERSLTGALSLKELKGLSMKDAEEMWGDAWGERLFSRRHLEHIIRILDFNPYYIKTMIQVIKDRYPDVSSLKGIYSIYFDELNRGSLGLLFSSIIGRTPPHLRNSAIVMLKRCSENVRGGVMAILSSLPCKREDAFSLLELFSLKGLIDCDLTGIRLVEDRVFRDYLELQYRKEIKGEEPEDFKGTWIWERLKELDREGIDAERMDIIKRCKSLLEGFSCQGVPALLFDYDTFKEGFDGRGDEEIKDRLKRAKDFYNLPLIVGSSRESIEDSAGIKSIILGYGFEDGTYQTGKDLIWLVGCFVLHPVASLHEVVSFIRHAKTIEMRFKGIEVVKWAIARDGFSKESLKELKDHGVLTSNLRQIDLLRGFIEIERAEDRTDDLYEFELILPMVSETELVAARAIEEIARKGNFDEDSINQIKMALIEACINAFEYSRSKEGKVALKFMLNGEKLTIYVENEGRGFEPNLIPEPSIDDKLSGANKRGWGIKLMRHLMDDVSFERINDSITRLKMVKYVS